MANDAPVTEDLTRKIGSFLNFLYDRQGVTYEEFTANGTFNVPANVNHVWVLGCGGGGGGSSSGGVGGGGGGAGGSCHLAHILVTPSAAIAVTIGAGGIDRTNGSNTTFGSLLTFYGGKGGATNTATGTVPNQLMSTTGGTGGAVDGTAGQGSVYSAGGAGSASGNSGGGGAGIGPGGTGGAASSVGGAAAANTGGGGGGGGTGVGDNGGAGGSGYLRVIYANS